MARVTCHLCGKGVDTTKGNYVYANGIHQHKKCPSSGILTEQEKADLRELTDAIDWVTKKQHKPLSPKQWAMVTKQIKDLKDQGYSYRDQLYALKWWLDIKGEQYKGFGIVGYIIEEALHYRKRASEAGKVRETKHGKLNLSVQSRPRVSF